MTLVNPTVLGFWRYRQIGKPYVDQNEFIQPDNAAFGFPVVNPINTASCDYFEAIFDEVRKNPGRGKRNVGYCYHVKLDATAMGPEQGWRGDYGHPLTFRHRKPLFFPFDEAFLGSSLVVPDSVRSGLCLDAANYFSEVFPELLSFSEFLFGITKLKELLPEVGDSIAKTISGGYLNKSFGWDNLLSDLEVLRTLFKDCERRLAYLRRIRGLGTRMHFTRNVDPDSLTGDWRAPRVWRQQRGFAVRHRTQRPRVVFSATSWLLETLDYIDGVVGMIRAMTGALGLNNPIKAIWVNIPGSFVVDWFFKIDKHLDHLTRLNPVGGWELSNITHTFRIEYIVKVDVIHDELNFWPSFEVPGGEFRVSLYERRAGLSLSYDSLLSGTLSPNMLTLLLAILHQLSAV